MAKDRIWTPTARQFLFEQVKEKFGPLSKWKGSKPGRGRDQAYDNLCDHFANVVGAKSADAVKLQIRFGMPTVGANRRGRRANSKPRSFVLPPHSKLGS